MTGADAAGVVGESAAPTPSRLEKVLARLRRAAPYTLLYSFFLALSSWTFLPVFSQLTEAFIGRQGSDVLRNAWGFWWFKAMLFERLRFPGFTVYLNYPRGMLVLLIDPLNCLLSLPLQLFFGLPAAYNLYLVAVVAFNGFSASLFARYLTGSMGAGLIAGSIYAFSPYVLSGSLAGNSEVVNVGWIPLYFLFFHRALTLATRRDGLLAGTLLVCTTLSSWYYGYIAGLFSALYALGYFVLQAARRRPLRPSIKALGWSALVFALFSAGMMALFYDIIPSVQKGVVQGGQDRLTVLAGNAVNLWDVYRPSPDRWDRPSLYHFPVMVLLALPAALLLGIRRAWSWALMGGVALLLALSYKVQTHPIELKAELWKVFEQLTVLSEATYNLFLQVPFSSVIRFPARFMVMVNLMVAVVLACGLGVVFVERPRLRPVWLLLGAAGAVWMTGELIRVARFHEIFSTTPAPVPAYVKKIAEDPDWVAVVNLPTDLQGGMQLYHQAVHHKPLLNYVDFVTSRIYYINGQQLPLSFSDLIYGMHQRGFDAHTRSYPDQVPLWPEPAKVAEELTRLKEAGLRYIVVERKMFKPASLLEFEALVKPLVTLELQADGVDLYRLK